jgi:phosphoribosylglycinamide formyltransferase-1
VTSVPPGSRVVVLISGAGTTLAALLDSPVGAGVVAVVSDHAEAGGLGFARAAGVPVEVVSLADFPTRERWNRALDDVVAGYSPDLVMLAGFMRVLDAETVARFFPRILNTHPALLPSFPGAHGVRDALAYGVKVAGCTVHLVDAGVDTGPIVAQATARVEDGDTEDSLHERIKAVERALVVATVEEMLARGWTVDGRHVTLGGTKEA